MHGKKNVDLRKYNLKINTFDLNLYLVKMWLKKTSKYIFLPFSKSFKKSVYEIRNKI